MLVNCIAPTVIGGNNNGGSGGSGGEQSIAVVVSTGTGVSPNNAIATREHSMNGDVLRVTVANFGQACPAPSPVPNCPDETSARMTFSIPASAAAGDTFSIQDGFFAVQGKGEQDCWGGGGTATGTVEVLSTAGNSLTLRLSNVGGVFEVDLEGVYNVPVCSANQPMTDAIALLRSELPGVGPSTVSAVSVGSGMDSGAASVVTSSGVGGPGAAVTSAESVGVGPGSGGSGPGSVVAVTSGGDPSTSAVTSGGGEGSYDDLFLIVGNQAPACEAPFDTGCAAPAYRVSVVLPLAFQQPGFYSLQGIATFFESETNCQGGGGGSYWDGSIEVLEVNEERIIFKLTGTSPLSNLPSADGVYSAPRCYTQGTSVGTAVVVSTGTGPQVATAASGY